MNQGFEIIDKNALKTDSYFKMTDKSAIQTDSGYKITDKNASQTELNYNSIDITKGHNARTLMFISTKKSFFLYFK